jgi:hypothetical protein
MSIESRHVVAFASMYAVASISKIQSGDTRPGTASALQTGYGGLKYSFRTHSKSL